MNLAEKWKEYRVAEEKELQYKFNITPLVWERLEAAFYAGAEEVADDYSIQNVKTEVAARKEHQP